MANLRTPTTWFMLLTLLPAVILAWQGWQATPLMAELERQTQAALERHGETVAAALPGVVAQHLAQRRAALEPIAEQLRRDLPDGSGERTLREHPLALVLHGAHAPIWPAGPTALRLDGSPEWPQFAAWRARIGDDAPLALERAREFVTPRLRALAIALCLQDDPERAAAALAEFAWHDLAAAGPLPSELLTRSELGRTVLGRTVLGSTVLGRTLLDTGLAAGALYRVPSTEVARARWLRAAGASDAECTRQDLRASAERTGAPEAVGVTVAPGVTLAALAPLDWPAIAAAWPSREFAVSLAAASSLAPPQAVAAGRATHTCATAIGPVTILTTSLTRDGLLRAARVQRLVTGLGLLLLVSLLGTGLWLVRRALLREQAARALRDDFIASVSHELKTPLTSLRLHAEMLAGDLDAPTRRSYGDVAVAEGARLSALVDDLLDFAALEQGRRRLEPEPVDLAGTVRALAATWRPLLARDHVALDVHTTADATALADPTALLRVLTNLLQNALRHGHPTRAGSPRAIELRAGDGFVEVRDNGPGVPPAERARIFERFARVHHDRPGVGLGLALSRELARAQQGDLTCDDDGVHTVFRLTLPTLPAQAEP